MEILVLHAQELPLGMHRIKPAFAQTRIYNSSTANAALAKDQLSAEFANHALAQLRIITMTLEYAWDHVPSTKFGMKKTMCASAIRPSIPPRMANVSAQTPNL
jgi:hypothetical protein